MNTAGAFVMDEISLLNKKLLLNAGLRFDMAAFGDGAFTIEKPSYSIEYMLNFSDTAMKDNSWFALNPRFSAQYAFTGKTRTFFTIARGFRAPILDDLCRSGRQKYGFRLANPGLGPEYITSYEWGLDVKVIKYWQFAVSVFYSRGKDYMYAVSTGDSVNMGYTISPVYKMQNISAVDISGIEAEIAGSITQHLKAFFNYTRNFTRISEFIPNTPADPNLTGKHLTDVPDHQANAGLRFSHQWINSAITAKYVGKRWINDRNIPDVTFLLAPQYPAYFNLDIKFWKTIGRHWQIELGIENIFDEIHIDDRGQKTPGRFVMAGVGWGLK
jgi:iron complex outermembrane receptor protein